MALESLRPDADAAAGSWTNEVGSGTNLYLSIKESVAVDTDYIQSSPNAADVYRAQISDPTLSGTATPATVRYRYKKTGAQSANVEVRLLQGVTVIARWQHVGITTSFVTAQQTLTTAQFNAISDFTNLFIEIEANPTALVPIDLDFVNGIYSGTLTGLMSCARSVGGYAQNANGTLTTLFGANTLRIGTKGLLIEDTRTNRILNSQSFTAASWAVSNTTATNNFAVAPDGTTTASRLLESSTNTDHSIGSTPGFTVTANAAFVFSIYVKQGTSGTARRYLRVNVSDSASGSNGFIIEIDFQTVTLTVGQSSGTGTYTSAAIETLANGWYRLSGVGKLGPSDVAGQVNLYMESASFTTSYTGNSTGNVYLWGAQWEETTAAISSYIPTTTVAVTRPFDAITLSGAALTAMQATAGSLVEAFDTMNASYIATTPAAWYSATGNAVVYTSGHWQLQDNNTSFLNLAATTLTTGPFKVGNTWDASNHSLGSAGATVVTAAMPGKSRTAVYVGSINAASPTINGYLTRWTQWSVKLSDADLLSLSQ